MASGSTSWDGGVERTWEVAVKAAYALPLVLALVAAVLLALDVVTAPRRFRLLRSAPSPPALAVLIPPSPTPTLRPTPSPRPPASSTHRPLNTVGPVAIGPSPSAAPSPPKKSKHGGG